MSLESERGGLSRRITRRQFAAASSVLLFADWVSGAEEVPKIPPAGPAIAPHRAGDVLNVRDFEPLARAALPPAHFGYLATGIDDDRTLRRNEQAFGDYEIRARRFVDLSLTPTQASPCSALTGAPRSTCPLCRRCVRSTLKEKRPLLVLPRPEQPK